MGELIGHGTGIYLANSSNNEVSYSEIHDGPRYGVAQIAWPNLPKNDIYVYNNTVKYLKLYDTNQDSGDTGSLMNFGISDDSPYLVNYFEQITIDHIYAHPSLQDQAPNGIFMDNDSRGQNFKNIEVTNTQGAQFRNNDSGYHTFDNVSWEGGFDSGLMDYDNIGTKSDFPY